jgi:hypothetical protein
VKVDFHYSSNLMYMTNFVRLVWSSTAHCKKSQFRSHFKNWAKRVHFSIHHRAHYHDTDWDIALQVPRTRGCTKSQITETQIVINISHIFIGLGLDTIVTPRILSTAMDTYDWSTIFTVAYRTEEVHGQKINNRQEGLQPYLPDTFSTLLQFFDKKAQ